MEILRRTTHSFAARLENPIFWIINVGAISLCFWSGPFGTIDALPSGIRLIYWGLIVVASTLIATWLHALIHAQSWVSLSRRLMVSIIFGVTIAAVVLLLSLSLLLPIQRYPGHTLILLYSFPSATILFFLTTLIFRSELKPATEPQHQKPVLLKRLEKYPHANTVLSLSAQDHYVEVTTDLGHELCLMRLDDAISEVAPENGFRIHRSHWVSKSAIKNLMKQGAKTKVVLIDGRQLSVSQARLSDFKDFWQKTRTH
ncbi:MAG: LytTR family DNA-binding domain-containing protein [Aestuariivita sp.]|nr:LytTR family DNA-binding domain-containing protein [Aestuariivita sp.]